MRYTIFCEGKWDKSFIEDYLIYLFSKVRINESAIEFVSTGGYTNLVNVVPRFQQTTDVGGINLVLFDADFDSTGGGFDNRHKDLIAVKKKLNIEFELFLFPNNSADGIFENLLESIICKDHQCIIDCFHGYEGCISGYNKSGIYNAPIQKSKMYAYIETVASTKEFEKSRKKLNMCYSNPKYWNMESNNINPLKLFIERNINL